MLIFSVARETGWSENTILDMPLSRLMQYYHCSLVFSGVACKWAKEAFPDAAKIMHIKNILTKAKPE